MSRTTSKLGWMTTWTSRSCRDSSMVSESTRKGMSSTTTSTTLCPLADQPCSASVGVATRTRPCPGAGRAASL